MQLVLRLSSAQVCPAGFESTTDQQTCTSADDCLGITNTDNFNCVNNYCCKSLRTNFCGVNEVSIAGVCYPVASAGSDCIYSSQCQPSHLICRNNICIDENRNLYSLFKNVLREKLEAECMDPNQTPERLDGLVKSCLDERCSPGFNCEYHPTFMGGDYICCGHYDVRYSYDYGIVRFYPGTRLPLECFESYQCHLLDTPYCVYSERYEHNVCCSTQNC
ncbi:unnamed protein product, partial [Mesorhabditis belari]|uniref:EB domain-containing protein n=1 Tax=Mesorhabditis belari TaxID=2138241 RepID=A0AAF3EWH0_9BILA